MSNQESVPVSAFIIALNEADRIGEAILSVREWADEVIVVDSGSSDDTVDIAKKLGAMIFHNEWPGFGEQKRFAEDQCRNNWLLNLDADERVTPALCEEIGKLFADGMPPLDYYMIPVADVFAHEEKPAFGAHSYKVIRLYDRGKGRFSHSPVHDSFCPDQGAKGGHLKSPMYHWSQRSISFSVAKMNSYSDAQVTDMVTRGKRLHPLRLLTEFPLSFLKSYVLRRNFLYGLWGFSHAMNYAYSRFLRTAKSYEYELMERAQKRRSSKGK